MVTCELYYRAGQKVVLGPEDVDPHLGTKKLDEFNRKGICVFNGRMEKGKLVCRHFIGSKPPRDATYNAKDISDTCPAAVQARTLK